MVNEREEIARKKYEDNLKYLYFSRYLTLRYAVTIFLFTNLFWLIFSLPYKRLGSIILAGIMTTYAAIAAIEQLTKMHNRKLDVPITRTYFWVQIMVNILLIIFVLLPFSEQFFPFATATNSKTLMMTILLIGIVLAIFCEKRIRNIVSGQDRYAKVIETFKKNH